MIRLSQIQGLSEANLRKLRTAGIDSANTLLERGSSPKGREELNQKTGISSDKLLLWIKYVDLFRINGIGTQYARLLEDAGVDTIPELAQRNAANLRQAMAEVNQKQQLVKKLPTQDQVSGWVTQAKKLPRTIQY